VRIERAIDIYPQFARPYEVRGNSFAFAYA
jgi:hypothetical protein